MTFIIDHICWQVTHNLHYNFRTHSHPHINANNATNQKRTAPITFSQITCIHGMVNKTKQPRITNNRTITVY
jgi:hypothetical protein